MGITRWTPSRPFRWLSYLAIWSLVAIFLLSQDAVRTLELQGSVLWRGLVTVWLTESYLWALLAPLVWLLAKRLPLTRRCWWRVLLIHLVLSVAVAVVVVMLFAAVTTLFGLRLRPTILGTFRFVLPIDLHLDVALYWAIIGVRHAFTLQQSAKARETQAARLELRASELERQLVQSRLGVLRMQLHPHFLFNTLNAITVLVRQSRSHEADEMLTNLSELLRHTLQEWENQEIPLRSETDFLRLYLDIERVRFQDRLSVDVALEPDTLEALVPTFLLQPLVENAIRHGVARRETAGNVTVRARRMDAMLELEIGDDGPGLGTTDGGSGTGLGLTNTRARLRQLYGSQQSLRLENHSPGTLVTIQIPYRLEFDHLP